MKKVETNYTLLDTGNQKRLEKFGDITVVRNAKQAVWKSALSKKYWSQADLIFENNKWNKDFPENTFVTFGDNKFEIKAYEKGQVGIFPEQLSNWLWLEKNIKSRNKFFNIINGFAYTGAATVFAGYENTSVCHLDSSKTSVNQAKKNWEISGKSNYRVRFIIDDVLDFLKKELKRGSKYNGFIFDPPAFGRGKKNKIWKFKRDLPSLFKYIDLLSDGNPEFILISAHEQGFSEFELKDMMKEIARVSERNIETGKMIIKAESGNDLPNGYYARWFKNV